MPLGISFNTKNIQRTLCGENCSWTLSTFHSGFILSSIHMPSCERSRRQNCRFQQHEPVFSPIHWWLFLETHGQQIFSWLSLLHTWQKDTGSTIIKVQWTDWFNHNEFYYHKHGCVIVWYGSFFNCKQWPKGNLLWTQSRWWLTSKVVFMHTWSKVACGSRPLSLMAQDFLPSFNLLKG